MTQVLIDDILEKSPCMKTWDYYSLVKLVAERRLGPARKLTVGQLRIATVPSVIRPEPEGIFDPRWLKPLSSQSRTAAPGDA